MVKQFTLKEILALNPQIGQEHLEEIQKLIYALHTSRVGKHRYNLIPPFTRPRVTIGEGDKTDSRTVILRQAKR